MQHSSPLTDEFSFATEYEYTMLKKRRQISLDRLHLTNPQREGVLQMLASQKNKYRKLLHEAHEKMHILTDLSASMEIWMNIDGSVEYVNPAVEKITGHSVPEFENCAITLEDLVHPDSRKAFDADRQSAANGEAGENAIYRFVRKDGEIRRTLVSWRPVFTRRGRCIGLRATITDITSVKSDGDTPAARQPASG